MSRRAVELIAGVIAALGTAAAAVIGALGFLKRAGAPTSRAVLALRGLWDWVELNGLADQVPERMARAVVRVLEDQGDDEGAK